MRGPTLTLACAGVVTMAGGALGGPPEERHIDPNAGWVVHLDLEAMDETRLGSFIMDMLSRETDGFADVREVMPNFWPGPEGGMFGVTLFGATLDIEGEGADGVSAVIYGDKQIAGWGSMLEAIAMHEGMEDEIRRRTMHGCEAWSFPLDDSRGYAGLVEKGDDVTWVIAFDAGTFDDALATVTGSHGGTELLPRDGWRDGTLMYLSTDTLDGLDIDEEASRVVGDARSIRMRLGEEGRDAFFQAALDTGDAEKANSVRTVAQGLIALGNLAAADDEELREVMRVASNLRLDTRGSTVYVELMYDAEEVVSFLEGAEGGDWENDWDDDHDDHHDDWDDHDDDDDDDEDEDW